MDANNKGTIKVSSNDLLELQINQLTQSSGQTGRRLTITNSGSSAQRPLPEINNDKINSNFEWKKRAEVAENQAKLLEDKIRKLAIAVKADREKHRQAMQELQERAEAAEAKSTALESKLSDLVELVKKERSKASSKNLQSVDVKSVVEEQLVQRVNEQVEGKLKQVAQVLKREKELSEQQKAKIEYLNAQLEEARDQLARQRSTYQPNPRPEGYQARPRRNKLVALYDFPGEKGEDLSFTEGEVLTLLKKYSGGWWLAEKNGRVGRVPSNFVNELESANRVTVRALGNFKAEKKSDLGFLEGDILTAFKTEEEWWVADLDGKVGWVPSNFVEEVQQQPPH